MNARDRIPFPDLEPPRGGAERFRARLESADREASPGFLRRLAAAGVVAVLAIAAIAAIAVFRDPDAVEPVPVIVLDMPELDWLLGRPMQPIEITVFVDDEPAALSALPVTTPGIRIYEIRPN